jgi:hypothetical protein
VSRIPLKKETKQREDKERGFIIEWEGAPSDDEGVQSRKITGFAHPGCCGKDRGGCPKKHG